MASFQSRIQDLAGDIPASADAVQFLKDGVIDVVHRIISTHPQHISLFSKNESISDSGTDVHDVHVQDVTRASTSCREILASGRHAAGDSASIYFATAADPVYYFLNEKIFVLPTGGSPTMSILEHGDVTNWDNDSSAISHMPSHHYHQVVMYAAIQLLEHKLATFGDDEDVEMMASITQQLQMLQQKYLASFMAPAQ